MDTNEKIKRKIFNAIGLVANRLSQNESGGENAADRTVTEGMPELLRKASAEGTVLLRNDGVLPLSPDCRIAVFGRVQLDWFFTGYGSGGDVIKPYTVNIIEGLENAHAHLDAELLERYRSWCAKNPPDHGFWGHWPMYHPEMPISENDVKYFAKRNDTALVVIGRAAGEDRENTAEEGSYLLTKDEKALLENVSSAFDKTVVILNIGSMIDLGFSVSLKNDIALLIPWQGGMESGNAAADVIFGKSEPSGRLTDTAAVSYAAYPSSDNFGNRDETVYAEDIFVGYRYFETFDRKSVLFPFGAGIGYGEFERETLSFQKDGSKVSALIKTKNIGKHPGKDVIEIYADLPAGKLSKPKRVLADFKKSSLIAPGCEETLGFEFDIYTLASYDDGGISGFRSCYLLESGRYDIKCGKNVRSVTDIGSFTLDETLVLSKQSEISAPVKKFKRLEISPETGEKTMRLVPEKTENLKSVILSSLPREIPFTGDKGIKLDDVRSKKHTLDSFIAQLTDTELEAISRGDYTMDSPLGNKGNAGVFGGVLQSLRDKGIKPVTTTDGPSGIRIGQCCSLIPNGVSVASMWNTELAEELYSLVSSEMTVKGSDMLLAPGMNIHRNPLCGRNFEYYSEDPVITGKTAAAAVRGIQKCGHSACPKHFACNDQETNRNKNDSVLSERALREIYLKGFEICVKEAAPKSIMTSYNKINGVWGHYNYDLCTNILRKEWNYDGLVITDWWMQPSRSPEFPILRDNAYRVRAGVDILMPGGKRSGRKKPDGTLLETLSKPGGITRGELQQTAKHVVRFVMKLEP